MFFTYELDGVQRWVILSPRLQLKHFFFFVLYVACVNLFENVKNIPELVIVWWHTIIYYCYCYLCS